MRKTSTLAKVPFLAPDVQTKVIPSPTDGWDAISPLAEMDPKRAPILINWVPRPGFVELRGGYNQYASTVFLGYTGPVETLMVYRSGTTEKMFAAVNNSIANVSTPPVTNTNADFPFNANLTSNRWQYVNFTPSSSTTVLQCVNGHDTLKQFDGTNWTAPAITGVPGGTQAIININAQKRRLWYILNNSTVAAYMPTDAITGPIAGTQDCGALWTKGGYMVHMVSWTVDGGSGPQDYACFISSRGQISIFSGTDPTNANVWALVGTFDISPPIGRRCALRVGSDVAIITEAGVLPISQVLPFDPGADRSVAITARIQNAMSLASQQAKGNFGWQMISFPAQTLAFLNVPLTENVSQQQYVMNELTGAWCQFTGWNANCFEIFNDKLYWGGNHGDVNEGYIGSSDGGTSIPADMQCAFNWMDEPGKVKRMTMVQPLLNLGGNLTPTMAVDVDFMTSTDVAPVATLTGGAAWDSATWDSSLWPGLSVNFIQWLSVDAIGHAMAIRMRVNITAANINFLGEFDVGVFDSAEFDAGSSPTLPLLQVNAFNTIYESGGAI